MNLSNIFQNLFGQDHIDSLEEAAKLIESILDSLGTNPEEAKMDLESKTALGWLIQNGTTYLFIYVFKTEDNQFLLKMVSPVVFMPEKNLLPFYRFLLESNLNLHDSTLGIEKNIIMMQSLRRVDLISPDEAKNMVGYLYKTSQEMAAKLSKEFEAKYYEVEA